MWRVINGSLFAPFIHNSKWPEEVLENFRAAVYYRHVPVPGRDCVLYLRELILYLEKSHPEKLTEQWNLLKAACNKTVHLAVNGASDEEMPAYTTNLLIFANLLLIQNFGFVSGMSLRFGSGDAEKDLEHAKGEDDARRRFLNTIDEAYSSLVTAIGPLSSRGTVNLESAEVLSPISSHHHLVRHDENPTFVMVLNSIDADVCNYAFRPHDPIGWEMTDGSLEKDRFQDDPMSSPGL